MAIYYIDALTFSAATAVYTNIGLDTHAPDGFYSFSGFWRQQSSGVLINPATNCTIHILASNVWIFNATRTDYDSVKALTASDTVINTGSQNVGNATGGSGDWRVGRLLSVFDTSTVTTLPISGTVSFYVTTNTVSTALTFNNVKPNATYTPLQTMTTSNWDDWNNSTNTLGGGTAESNFSLPFGSTGKKTFNLSSSQLSDIYNNPAFAYFLISNGDLGAVTPSTNDRPLFSSEKGLGISGVGDYELVLNF